MLCLLAHEGEFSQGKVKELLVLFLEEVDAFYFFSMVLQSEHTHAVTRSVLQQNLKKNNRAFEMVFLIKSVLTIYSFE